LKKGKLGDKIIHFQKWLLVSKTYFKQVFNPCFIAIKYTNEKKDFYEILGISKGADAAEIKKAYRKVL
jgi:preprotein translocase subunit Sec63